MHAPFDVAELTTHYSERRIRIADMVGRRGRFATIALAGFFYLYQQVSADRNETFATFFLQQNLFDAVVTSWIFLALFKSDRWLASVLYGSAARVMDGVLARSNMLLITTLWTAFKFVMVPIGGALARAYPADQFAVVFALIWGSYIVTDALAEIGGSLYGKQTLRVWGIGDVNRKSVGGTVTGLVGCLVFCLWLLWSHGLPPDLAWAGGGDHAEQHRRRAVRSARHRRLLHGDDQRGRLPGVRPGRAGIICLWTWKELLYASCHVRRCRRADLGRLVAVGTGNRASKDPIVGSWAGTYDGDGTGKFTMSISRDAASQLGGTLQADA